LFPVEAADNDFSARTTDVKEEPMKSLVKKVHRFLVAEDGPTAVEYAVMLALIVIVCLTAITSLGTAARDTFDEVANSVSAV
jgi:pilus assembly protein Flp/PilA